MREMSITHTADWRDRLYNNGENSAVGSGKSSVFQYNDEQNACRAIECRGFQSRVFDRFDERSMKIRCGDVFVVWGAV
jgi:hypothetical protein